MTTTERDSADSALDPEWYAAGTNWKNVIFYQRHGNQNHSIWTWPDGAVGTRVSANFLNERWQLG
ncbi:hypothetical protein [Herbidospora daliensis]|uniref:hypothetical protein n=1 Tax=Herbidospora daliensis TaxID=295585 RepID=UPI0007863E85|nr:hypothetical protein [Herbidospora daliensis]